MLEDGDRFFDLRLGTGIYDLDLLIERLGGLDL